MSYSGQAKEEQEASLGRAGHVGVAFLAVDQHVQRKYSSENAQCAEKIQVLVKISLLCVYVCLCVFVRDTETDREEREKLVDQPASAS